MTIFLLNKNLITFIIQFSVFSYIVMLFYNCNRRAFLRNFIKHFCFDFLNHFVKAYVNDIFIDNKMLKDHSSYIL